VDNILPDRLSHRRPEKEWPYKLTDGSNHQRSFRGQRSGGNNRCHNIGGIVKTVGKIEKEGK
jgi:hypothetical protein